MAEPQQTWAWTWAAVAPIDYSAIQNPLWVWLPVWIQSMPTYTGAPVQFSSIPQLPQIGLQTWIQWLWVQNLPQYQAPQFTPIQPLPTYWAATGWAVAWQKIEQVPELPSGMQTQIWTRIWVEIPKIEQAEKDQEMMSKIQEEITAWEKKDELIAESQQINKIPTFGDTYSIDSAQDKRIQEMIDAQKPEYEWTSISEYNKTFRSEMRNLWYRIWQWLKDFDKKYEEFWEEVWWAWVEFFWKTIWWLLFSSAAKDAANMDYSVWENEMEVAINQIANESVWRWLWDWFRWPEKEFNKSTNAITVGLVDTIDEDYTQYLNEITMWDTTAAATMEKQIVDKAAAYLDSQWYNMKDWVKLWDIIKTIQDVSSIRDKTYTTMTEHIEKIMAPYEKMSNWIDVNRMWNIKMEEYKQSMQESTDKIEDIKWWFMNKFVTPATLDYISQDDKLNQIQYIQEANNFAQDMWNEISQWLQVYDEQLRDISKMKLSEEDYEKRKAKIEEEKQKFLDWWAKRLEQLYERKLQYSAQNIWDKDVNVKWNKYIQDQVRAQWYDTMSSFILDQKPDQKDLTNKMFYTSWLDDMRADADRNYFKQLKDSQMTIAWKVLPFIDTSVQLLTHEVLNPFANSFRVKDLLLAAVPVVWPMYMWYKTNISPFVSDMYATMWWWTDLTSSDLWWLAWLNLNQEWWLLPRAEKLWYNVSDKAPETAVVVWEFLLTRKIWWALLWELKYVSDANKISTTLRNSTSALRSLTNNFIQWQVVWWAIWAQLWYHYDPWLDAMIDLTFGMWDVLWWLSKFQKSMNIYENLPENFLRKYSWTANFWEWDIDTLYKVSNNVERAIEAVNKVNPEIANFAAKKWFIKNEIQNLIEKNWTNLTKKQMDYINALQVTLKDSNINVADLISSKIPMMIDETWKPLFWQWVTVKFWPRVSRWDASVPVVSDIKPKIAISWASSEIWMTQKMIWAWEITQKEIDSVSAKIQTLKERNPLMATNENLDVNKIFVKTWDDTYRLTENQQLLDNIWIKDWRTTLEKLEWIVLSKDLGADKFYRKAIELWFENEAWLLQSAGWYEKVLDIFSNVLC